MITLDTNYLYTWVEKFDMFLNSYKLTGSGGKSQSR